MGFAEKVDKICGSVSSFRELSYFVASWSVFLVLTTCAANALILLALKKHRHLMSRNFYIIIANIAIADLLNGLVVAPLSTSFHLKEALGPDVVIIQPVEQSVMTYLFFLTNGVSVLSMAVLSIDRMGVLLNPFFYYAHLKRTTMLAVLLTAWIVMSLLPVVYLRVGYIRFLAIFASSTVALTMFVMATTMVLLRRRVRAAQQEGFLSRPKGSDADRIQQDSGAFTRVDLRITKTFMVMLLLFFIIYLPCVVLIIYMNVCTTCDCSFIHVMRDLVFAIILSSGLCRALNFLVRLDALHDAVKSILSMTRADGVTMPLSARL